MTITNRVSLKSVNAGNTPISDVPNAPTIGAVADSGDGTTATVAYTAATTGGAATTFTATSSPGGLTGTGSSPISVTGLVAGTAYTFTVTASNSTGSATSSSSSSLTLAAIGVFESIATFTPTSGTSITFSNIPQTYKHLQLRSVSRDTEVGVNGNTCVLRFNSDTASNYSWHYVFGEGTIAQVGASANDSLILGPFFTRNTSTVAFAATVIDILDYTNTNKYKTTRALAGYNLNSSTSGQKGEVYFLSGLWRSTTAITSISLTQGTSFVSGTKFALYGIKG